MKILIAEDNRMARGALSTMLDHWGYTVSACADGAEAWDILQQHDAPSLVLLDWMMPRMNGLQVCQNLRQMPERQPVYVILLTGRQDGGDIVAGLQAGADDYMTKPFHGEELHARLDAGMRVLQMQQDLADRVRVLEESVGCAEPLHGFLPICSYCKKIRNTRNYWEQLESYITEHSNAEFSHSICPHCYDEFAKPELEQSKLNTFTV